MAYMIRMNFHVVLLFGMLSMVACGPSGPQNNLIDEDEGEYYDEYEEEYDNMQDGMDEEDGEYVELPDWMDVDLDQLPIEKISMLNSAKNLTQLMTLLELSKTQQDKMEKGGPVELGRRTVGDKGPEIAECKPELEVVKMESPPNILYLPQCFRLPRCGGCCTGNLLSCQPTRTQSIKIKVIEAKKSYRSIRSTRRRRKRGSQAKYVMVDQVNHLECSCQCRIKEQDCDTSIQEYEKSECACVCKNRDKEIECVTKNTHIWDPKSCSCRCKKIRECSTGEEFSQNSCRCIPIIGGRIFNSNSCDSLCENGKPVECSCKDGWKGRRCNEPICAPGCVQGRCVSPDTCECQEGWRGDQCQHHEVLRVLQPYSLQPSRKDCKCIPITLCKPLLNLERNYETKMILKKATCDKFHNPPKVCCPSLLPSYCGQPAIDTERIYGGKEVKMGKYPWIAVLGFTDSNHPDEVYYHCGGSVINERYVLTAAHCVRDLGSKILSSVVLGEWDQSTEIDCDENNMCLPAPMVYRPEKVIAHPNYLTRGTFSDDIALIRLDASVNIDGDSSSFIRAVCLPEPSMDIRQVLTIYKRNRINLELSVSGWGVTEHGTLSDKLLEVELPLVEDSHCNRTYNGRIVSGQMCAGGSMGEDSCAGDSGGPLILPGPTSTTPYLQVGVVSFGPQHCGRQNYPGVYTEVSMYREWIEENIEP